MGIANLAMVPRVVLFTDLHNFSAVAQKLGTRQADFLQALYEMLGDLIIAYNGEIHKYTGDGLLCFFPAEGEHDAVNCALAMHQAFKPLVKAWEISDETDLEIGITAGEIITGIMGHASFRQKEAFGDAINTAARIGHHRGIAITEAVHAKIKTDHKTQRLPDLHLKWLSTPIAVWEIIV